MAAYNGVVALQPKTGDAGAHATAVLRYVRPATANASTDTITWANPFATKVILRGGTIILNAMDSNASPATFTIGNSGDADGLLTASAAGFSSATANNVIFHTLDGALIDTVLEPDQSIVLTVGTIGTALTGAKIALTLFVQGA